MKFKPLIDDLLDDYLPKRYYGHEARKHAKELALKFFELARQQRAMEGEINTELFFGKPLTEEERRAYLKTWGYVSERKVQTRTKGEWTIKELSSFSPRKD